MPDEAIKKQLRRFLDATAKLLNEESYHVSVAYGKSSDVYDLACCDKGCWKIVKVCLDTISRHELDMLLGFNDTPYDNGTILQIFFWTAQSKKPFYRFKLFYNRPDQPIPDELQKLVK